MTPAEEAEFIALWQQEKEDDDAAL